MGAAAGLRLLLGQREERQPFQPLRSGIAHLEIDALDRGVCGEVIVEAADAMHCIRDGDVGAHACDVLGGDILDHAVVLLVTFPEGFLNGTLISAFAVFYPDMVKTYDDVRYLGKPR